jgi:hypothetical protein
VLTSQGDNRGKGPTKAFIVLYEVSAGSKETEPRSREVLAPSADRAAEMVAKDHNARVNSRDLWIHSVRELPPDGEQAP